MFKVEDNEIYYVVDREKKTTIEIGSFKELLNWLSTRVLSSGGHKTLCYDKFDFSGNDIGFYTENVLTFGIVRYDSDFNPIKDWYFISKKVLRPRRYMILNDKGNIINVRLFEEEIKEVIKNKSCWKAPKLSNVKYGDLVRCHYRYRRENSPNYYFRRGPVPFIHNYNNWHCSYNHHRAQNYKQKDLIRPKTRIDRADLWDGPYRHTDRCWKTSCKKRHQWEKHFI